MKRQLKGQWVDKNADKQYQKLEHGRKRLQIDQDKMKMLDFRIIGI